MDRTSQSFEPGKHSFTQSATLYTAHSFRLFVRGHVIRTIPRRYKLPKQHGVRIDLYANRSGHCQPLVHA